MIIPLEPNLEGPAEKLFFDIARQILHCQEEGNARKISSIVEEEISRVNSPSDFEGPIDCYEACLRVLGDLAQLRWKLVENSYGIELHSPQSHNTDVMTPGEIRDLKETIRGELGQQRQRQFEDKHVKIFIQRMERPPSSARHKSIQTLIENGTELHSRLTPARKFSVGTEKRDAALAKTVQPYLQLVEPGARDKYTDIRLQDIWRYFRYTWSIPQTPIPGRNLLYLVRDGAHANHAVIGIAGLSNCTVQMTPRDRHIGWKADSLRLALTAILSPAPESRSKITSDKFLQYHGIYQKWRSICPDGGDATLEKKIELLQHVHDWLVHEVNQAIEEIEHTGLVTLEEIADPSENIIIRLRNLSKEFSSDRQEVLQRNTGLSDEEIKAYGVPVDEDVLNLDKQHGTNRSVHDSRRLLIIKKRALELSRLLDAKRHLSINSDDLQDPKAIWKTLEQTRIRAALNTAMNAIKGRRIGTNILEITTCGAIAPYNHMLGGKLVALMLLSPQISNDYARRYNDAPTIIRSQLKNKRVAPDNTLVWLNTTSLFSHGSSQYERLRLPAGVIAPDQEEIRYHYIGNTTGYGTIQFSAKTVRSLDVVMQAKRGFRDVNNIFGEGASPKLRKLTSGLKTLGFNPRLALLHHQERRIYSMPLFSGAGAHLCGLEDKAPNYVLQPEKHVDASERIADFWRCRWLAQRIDHESIMKDLCATQPQALSPELPTVPSNFSSSPKHPKSHNEEATMSNHEDDKNELEFWRKLARAGSNVIAEGLSESDFSRLHIKTKLEDWLLDQARDGQSIILTGNAGDGKTHIAKALQQSLGHDANNFDFIFDATAEMNRLNNTSPILTRWNVALQSRKPIVLAINQYPFYLLRKEIRKNLPDISKTIEQQWNERLVYDRKSATSSPEQVILVDLSLRNPLGRHFAGEAFQRMLMSPAVCRHAQSGIDSRFTSNYRCLVDEEVRNRLLTLFERVISAGGRATVRELWILCARLLFGAQDDEGVSEATGNLYFQRLFKNDPRFPLTGLLRQYADPAGTTHPHIDRCLETPGGTNADEWRFGHETSMQALVRPATTGSPKEKKDRCHAHFIREKRRYYFEHVGGGGETVFSLDYSAHAKFHELINNGYEDTSRLQELIESINYCYFPIQGENMKRDIREHLYLWIGHRLDEQPTTSYVANESIPYQQLCLKRPEPPPFFRGKFNYVADHILLGVIDKNCSLRIDAELYASLNEIEQGLPRHLVNLGSLNRLDSFIDNLRRTGPPQDSQFLTYNAEHVVSSVIRMSHDYSRYETIQRI